MVNRLERAVKLKLKEMPFLTIPDLKQSFPSISQVPNFKRLSAIEKWRLSNKDISITMLTMGR